MVTYNKKSTTDLELINDFKTGSEQAIALLIKRYKTKVFSQIMMFVRDQMTAEDIFQDTFIKAIDTIKSGKYIDEGKFSQWICRIAFNMCVDHHRRNKRMQTVHSTDEFDVMDILPASNQNAEDGLMQNQTASRVRKLVDMLPADQREVVLLRHFAELSFKEISDLTHVSINTALGRMRYALINIRRMIDEKQLAM
jgi:RNA polymerase sigma-70 factor (ECF subfamily)